MGRDSLVCFQVVLTGTAQMYYWPISYKKTLLRTNFTESKQITIKSKQTYSKQAMSYCLKAGWEVFGMVQLYRN